jgi:hypothetical protein
VKSSNNGKELQIIHDFIAIKNINKRTQIKRSYQIHILIIEMVLVLFSFKVIIKKVGYLCEAFTLLSDFNITF